VKQGENGIGMTNKQEGMSREYLLKVVKCGGNIVIVAPNLL